MNYKGNTTTFEFSQKEDYINKGGNGAVFRIKNFKKLDLTPIDGEFVAKKFNIYKRNRNYEKRKERFLEEINFLTTVGTKINGVVDVVDYIIDDNKGLFLYVMPKLDEYDFSNDDLRNKLIKLIKIAETLKQIHNFDDDKKYSHRDIKPSNIMLKNDEPIICDFGLVWDAKRPKLTDTDESVGPKAILPPELSTHKLPNFDYRKSDVYLFAKLCWSYIKNQEIGFAGSYFRNESYYLKNEELNVQCLEPLNEMIEICTKGNLNERENIDFCIKKLQDQLSILDGCLDKEKLESYKNKESILKFVSQRTPSSIEYVGDQTTIETLLKLIKQNTVIKIYNGYTKEELNFNFNKYIYVNKIFLLLNTSSVGVFKKIYFNPSKIIYNRSLNLLSIKCLKIVEGAVEESDKKMNDVFVADALCEIVIRW